MNRLLRLAVVVAPLTVGCGMNISSTRMGASFPPRASDCSIKFENLNYSDATGRYGQQIGMVTVSGVKKVDAHVEDMVRPEACKMGGDLATLNAATDSGSSMVGSMIQYLIFKLPLGSALGAPQSGPAAP
jgi:hypothetical protein